MELQRRLFVVEARDVATLRRSAMACSIEYRKYMDECLRAAARAASEDERKSLLQLAQTWHEAASNLEASGWAHGREPDGERAGQPPSPGAMNSRGRRDAGETNLHFAR